MAEALKYDLVIIGSGPGGYVAAIRAGQLGLKTLVIEKEEKLGGTCLHWGCIPTKALLFTAEVYDYFKNAAEHGIRCSEYSLDWSAVQARKNKVVKKLAKGIEFLFKKNKVETMRGRGQLAGAGRVSVTDPQGETREVEAKHIILATGSEAKVFPGLEPDGSTVLTNKEILDLKEIPKSMVIIGAGAVGVEFASIFRRLGTTVTVLEMLPRAVPLEDEEVSTELARAFRKQGIIIDTHAAFQGADKTADGVAVRFLTAEGKPQKVEAETLLLAMGRAPNTANLGLERTRAALDRGFLKVNQFMQSGEPGLYAIGDIVAGSPPLAHVASMEGLVAVSHAAGKPTEPINYRQIPSGTYCEPQIGSVGMTEAQARAAGHKVRVGKFPFSANSKATILGVREGFVKILSDDQYGEILGVHIIGPGATELIAEAVATMRLEGTVLDISHTVHGHPTLSEAMLEAAHGVYGMSIHI